MKTLLPLVAFIFCTMTCLKAQPTLQWEKCYGGSNDDGSGSIRQTADGGYIVAGGTSSGDGDVTGYHSYGDMWIVKLDTSGTIQWQKCLGGTWGDAANCIEQTSDGGYIVAGLTTSSDGDASGLHSIGFYDYWLVKLDSTGMLLWQKSLGGTIDDAAYSVKQTADGGYIVAGFSSSNDSDVTGNHMPGNRDYWVVKTDSAGTIQWQKCLGGTQQDEAYSIQLTADSGYIIAGYSDSDDGDVTGHHGAAGIADYWVVKLNSSGVLQWQKSLGGSNTDKAYDIKQTPDRGYIVAGFAGSSNGDITSVYGGGDCWVVKLDTLGLIEWQKNLGGTNSEQANSIQLAPDGKYIVAGTTGSNDGNVSGNHGTMEYWVVQLDSSGAIDWQKCVGGLQFDFEADIQITTDGGYIVTGTSSSNDSYVTGNHGNRDYWVVKLSPAITGLSEMNNPVSDLQISPNPASLSAAISFSLSRPENISLSIYDITGRVIRKLFEGILATGNHRVEWNLKDDRAVAPGIYFLNIQSAGLSKSCRVVVAE